MAGEWKNTQTISQLATFIVLSIFLLLGLLKKRKPLSEGAQRKNWIGCNILLNDVPNSGKIFYIKNKQVQPKDEVIKNWRKTLFLREAEKSELKGWILDVMRCIDKLQKTVFTLSEMYFFEEELQLRHPNNKHIKDKIRQQLQFLRDKGYLEFQGYGKYKLI